MERVTTEMEGNVTEMEKVGTDVYQTSLTAPIPKNAENTNTYQVNVTAIGDNGEQSEETHSLIVEGSGVFPLKFTVTQPNGKEIGFIGENVEVDEELGEKNDFALRISANEWTQEKFGYCNRIFIPDTEYGGIICDIESITSTNEVVIRGPTWRGMLKQKVIQPPEGQEHIIVSGEINNILRDLIGDRFGGLFVVPEVNSGIEVASWQVDRYVTLLDAIMKLIGECECRLQISYIEPEGLEYGYVAMYAVPIRDYSEDLEFSKDGNVKLDVRDYRGGINHLVCAGKGENEERIELHLYVQEDGSIGKTQYYHGLYEREAVYNYTGADLEELEKGGTKRLKELQNYKSCKMTVEDVDLELGDIVSGYDQITDTQVIKPVVGKILTVQNGVAEIEYKVKGDD